MELISNLNQSENSYKQNIDVFELSGEKFQPDNKHEFIEPKAANWIVDNIFWIKFYKEMLEHLNSIFKLMIPQLTDERMPQVLEAFNNIEAQVIKLNHMKFDIKFPTSDGTLLFNCLYEKLLGYPK
jgi:hypothetical protein